MHLLGFKLCVGNTVAKTSQLRTRANNGTCTCMKIAVAVLTLETKLH